MTQTNIQMLDDLIAERDKLKEINKELLEALEVLEKHYRRKIVVHDTMLSCDHPLLVARAAIEKARK